MLQQIFCKFLAPVPVGHPVAIEYVAITHGGKSTVERHWFFVVDLTSGVRYGSQYAYGRAQSIALAPSRRVVETYSGVVRSCEVSSLMGNENLQIWTLLNVEFPDPPH